MRTPNIMIVDDDKETRSLLRLVLEDAGYQVEEAHNGLQLFRSLRVNRPALILLDVMMPWLDGCELCRSVKRNPFFADIPIAFLSGRTSPEDIRRGRDCGAAHYFTKPLDIDAFLPQVAQLLAPARPRAGASAEGQPAAR